MSSTNKTTYYNLSQYMGTDKPTYLGDYNSDMLAIDTAIHEAADDASTAVSTANTANATATTASSNASSALSTANSALETANTASTTATTASNNASAALTAAENAETAASANTIENLAPAYDPTLTYAVDDLVTYIDSQGSGKLYKCIVAVETPEAFNINKWDDVTTNEVYKPLEKIIATLDIDASTTFNDLCNFLAPYANINKAAKLEIVFSNTTRIYNCLLYNGQLAFSNIIASGTNTLIDVIGFYGSNVAHRYTLNNTALTYTDILNDTITSTNATANLIA